MNPASFTYIEFSDFTVRVIRAAATGAPLKIDDLKEIPTPDFAGALDALRNQIGPVEGRLVCAIRPQLAGVNAGNAGAANGAEAYALGFASATGERWLAAADGSTGAAPRGGRWVAAVCGPEEFQQWQGILSSLQLKPGRVVAATWAAAGAVVGTFATPTLVLEIGDARSQGILVDRDGIAGATTVSVNRDKIAEVVQSVLTLKFRGSAAKLFFNPDYDFNDVAAKIAAPIAEQLKGELASLRQGKTAPAALYCPTLPVGQHWFVAQLANALGLALHTPDLKGWSAKRGLVLPDASGGAGVGPAWLSALHGFHAQASAGDAAAPWQPEWRAVKAGSVGKAVTVEAGPGPVPVVLPAKPVIAEVPATPAAKPGATIPPVSVIKPAAPSAVPTPVKNETIPPTPVAPKAPAPTTAARPTPPVAIAAKAATPLPSTKGNPSQGKKGQSASAPTPKAAPASAPAKSGNSSVSYPPKPESATAVTPTKPAIDPAPAPSTRKKGMPIALIALAAVLVLGIGGFFVFKSQKDEAARLVVEKAKSEQRLKEEQERARLAEKKVAEEAEARRRTEQDLAQKLVASETARQQAEEEAKRQASARAANARGTVVIATEPSGASVTVGSLPTKVSPATFSDVRTGRYPVTVTLEYHDPVKFEVEIKENETTTPAKVVLARVVGALELASTPAGAAFEVAPANAMVVALNARKSGRTPATLENLTPGDYVVTFTREGWAPQKQTVTVTRNGTAHAAWTLASGNVTLSSEPTGAKVRVAGRELGVTPLVLKDQAPGAVEYELVRDDYDRPATVKGRVEAGKTLALTARFAAEDRLYAARELSSKPVAGSNKPPAIPYYMSLEKPRIDLELTVAADGSLRNFHVIQSSHRDLVKYCTDAMSKWKYKPATVNGKPVSTRITVSLTQFASNE